jgi:hypothetical protein
MRPRSTFAWIALALVGMAVAAGASLFASRLTSQDIGLSSEQLTAGKDLAPQQSQAEIDAAATKQRADAQDRRRRVAARKRRQRQAAATPAAPPATTTTTTPAPPVRSAPPATTTDDHGGGGDSSGKGRGRGRGGDDSPDD